MSVLRRSPFQSFAMRCRFPETDTVLFEGKVPKPSGVATEISLIHSQCLIFRSLSLPSPHTIFGYRSAIFSIFFSRNSMISSSLIDSRIYVRHRERRALITVKLGFSVVAPMRVMIPFSTQGRRTSCWDLVHLWISSRKRIVCRPDLKLAWAFAIILMTSSFFASTAERWKNSASRDCDMTLARLVFPHHGGPQRRIEGSRPASMNFLIGFPSPIRWDCQTRSLKFSGRRSEARGVMSFEKRECMGWIVRIYNKM